MFEPLAATKGRLVWVLLKIESDMRGVDASLRGMVWVMGETGLMGADKGVLGGESMAVSGMWATVMLAPCLGINAGNDAVRARGAGATGAGAAGAGMANAIGNEASND